MFDEPINPEKFTIKITFQQLLHDVSFLFYSKKTKNIYPTLSFNSLVELVRLLRIDTLVRTIEDTSEVLFVLWNIQPTVRE